MRRAVPVAVLLLAACAGTPPPAAAPGVNLSGFPPGFRAGYADGCASASERRRDEARFRSETDYAQGWRDGYDSCRRRK